MHKHLAALAAALILSGCSTATASAPVTTTTGATHAVSGTASPTTTVPPTPLTTTTTTSATPTVTPTATPSTRPSGTGDAANSATSTLLRAPVGRCSESAGVVSPPASIESVCWFGQSPESLSGTTIVIGHSTYSTSTAGYLERWVPARHAGEIVRFEGKTYRVYGAPVSAKKGALPAWVFSTTGERVIAVVTCDQSSPHTLGADGVHHTADNLVLRLVPVG